jgi:hypothetical protein
LLYLFGDHSERREQLHEYLDNHLSHPDCGRDLGINVEAKEEMLNRLEQIDQYIVAIINALDRLISFGVIEMRSKETKERQIRRAEQRVLCVSQSRAGNSTG